MFSSPVVVKVRQNTPEWLAWRSSGGEGNPFPAAVGGSDASIIMGEFPDYSADDLWAEKLGLQSRKLNPIMEKGHELEPAIRERIQGVYDTALPAVCLQDPERPWRLASLDGRSPDGSAIAECKLCGKVEYEAVLDGAIPKKWYGQLQHNLAVAGADVLYLGVARCESFTSRNFDFASVIVFPDEEYQAKLLTAEEDFLACIVTGVRPSESRPATAAPVPAEPPAEPPAPAPAGPQAVVSAPVAPTPPPAPPRAVLAPSARPAVALVPHLSDMERITLAPEWIEKRDAWVREAEGLAVIDDESAEAGVALIRNFAEFEKGLKAQAQDILEPFQLAIDNVKKAVNEALSVSAPAKESVSKALTVFRQEQERLAKELADAAAKAIAEARANGETPVAVAIPKAKKLAGTRTTRNIRFTVTNAAIIPVYLKVVDESAVKNEARRFITDLEKFPAKSEDKAVEIPSIPGAVFWVEEKTGSSGR